MPIHYFVIAAVALIAFVVFRRAYAKSAEFKRQLGLDGVEAHNGQVDRKAGDEFDSGITDRDLHVFDSDRHES